MANHAHTTTPAPATRRAAREAGGVLDRRDGSAAAAVTAAPATLDRPVTGHVRPSANHFLDGVPRPDAYGCNLQGNCLEPQMFDGDMALASPSETPQVGDLVVLHPANGGTSWLKRLVMAPMFPVGTPLHPDSDVMSVVVVEMVNPPKQFMIPIDRLKAMHRVVGIIPKAELAALRVPLSKPKQRRKAVVA